jgi:hypothetical protein
MVNSLETETSLNHIVPKLNCLSGSLQLMGDEEHRHDWLNRSIYTYKSNRLLSNNHSTVQIRSSTILNVHSVFFSYFVWF